MPPRPWIRLHRDLLNSRKVQRLSPADFKGWINLLLASSNDGAVPPADDLCFVLRMSEADIGLLLGRLVEAELVDETDGGFVVHDWEEWQYSGKTSTERVRAFRERKRNAGETVSGNVSPSVAGNVAETPRARPRVTEQSRAEQSRADRDSLRESFDDQQQHAARLKQQFETEFDDVFWPAYPTKEGKKLARAKFLIARRTHPLATVMDGLARYIANKPDDRSWMHASTFLNQERFMDDAPAPSGPNRRSSAVLRTMAEDLDGAHDDRRGGEVLPPGRRPERSPTIIDLKSNRPVDEAPRTDQRRTDDGD